MPQSNTKWRAPFVRAKGSRHSLCEPGGFCLFSCWVGRLVSSRFWGIQDVVRMLLALPRAHMETSGMNVLVCIPLHENY